MSTVCATQEVPRWHQDLVCFLGLIRRRAGQAYRHLPVFERHEAVAEVIADVTAEFARLAVRGIAHVRFIPPLIEFAIRRRTAGRRVGTPTNRRDVLSPVPRRGHRVVSLDAASTGGMSWRDILPDSRRDNPAAIACTRIDFENWLEQLPTRLRHVAEGLAAGDRPGELAAQLKISPGRLSQLRTELRRRWDEFSDEDCAPLIVCSRGRRPHCRLSLTRQLEKAS